MHVRDNKQRAYVYYFELVLLYEAGSIHRYDMHVIFFMHITRTVGVCIICIL